MALPRVKSGFLWSQIWGRRRWSKGVYVCILTPVLPFFSPSGGVQMIINELRTSSLQGKCVRICYSWYFTKPPLFTSYPKLSSSENILWKDASWSQQIWVTAWQCGCLAWHQQRRRLCLNWLNFQSYLLPQNSMWLLSGLGEDSWLPNTAIVTGLWGNVVF